MVKDETFAGWIIVSRKQSPVYTLVNPAHIENIYSSGNETIVCLTSGKKLVDKRPIDRFLKAEGGGRGSYNLPAVSYFGSVLQEVEERYKIIEKAKKVEKKVKAEPKKLRCKVVVDSYVGTSQGSLPIPVGFRINRDLISVTTANGMELGRGSLDGQIKDVVSKCGETSGYGVSGYISTNGTYELVFKDAAMGVGIIHFEVIKK